MLEEIKRRVEVHGYIAHLEDGELCIFAQNGYLKSNNEPGRNFVASINLRGGKLFLTKIIIPYSRTWEMKNADEVVSYLLEKFPNLEIGEEMTWE
jgi:hypothetical protein